MRSRLERGHGPLQPFARRVLRAGVFVATSRPPDAVLGIGRGLVDRRRDGPGQLVGFGAGMDGQRVEGLSSRSGVVGLIVHRGIMASAGSGCDVPAVELEHELLAVDVVDLDADLAEAESADDRQRRDVVRRDRRPEPGNAVLARRPVEERTDDLRRDSLASVRRLDPVADLDATVRVGWSWNPADPIVWRVRRPRSARLPGRATAGLTRRSRGRRSGTAGSCRVIGHVRRDDRPDLTGGASEVAGQQQSHEPQRHRHKLEPRGPDRGTSIGRMVAFRVIRVPPAAAHPQ